MDALQAIYERRSCRCFLPQQVDERQLTTVLAAGTHAPDGHGTPVAQDRRAAKSARTSTCSSA